MQMREKLWSPIWRKVNEVCLVTETKVGCNHNQFKNRFNFQSKLWLHQNL